MGGKRSNGFDKDPERARLAGKKSSRALPPEVKAARQLNAVKFEEIIYKYMGATVDELKEISKDPKTPAIDHIVIKLLSMAISKGDIARLNLLLERTIGKVTEKVDINANVKTMSLHQMIIEEIKKNEASNS